MSPITSSTATITKPIFVKFTGATTNDPVIVKNLTTGEELTTQPNGTLLRLDSKDKGIIFDCENFTSGWTVDDIIRVNIGGAKTGTARITLTAATNAPQHATVTAVAVSTAVLDL